MPNDAPKLALKDLTNLTDCALVATSATTFAANFSPGSDCIWVALEVLV